MSPRAFWPPLWAGIGLGLALFLTFVLTGHGLGASGFFTRLTADLGQWIAPELTSNNRYLGDYLSNGVPLQAWITWEVVGAFIGALVGALSSRRFRPQIERGPTSGAVSRLFMALLGGILTGLGARLARGCTSGLGLSGGAALAVGGFIFLICFFAAGFLFSFIVRRYWQ
ncbi:YeeE/YedE family protein [Marinobacter sediminum]|uniref:YeeE/YedE thiosulfate transporter family protein n=1 Tax=Marinobacter sediminum TaxID=256323 RepID=UPI002030B8FF|nr:YeeE/YedE thiosulfate transporter family protein [Marinobacter sediminum]MCM0612208.1 YeeE/YedE family protein [Marinobacter sediminum]